MQKVKVASILIEKSFEIDAKMNAIRVVDGIFVGSKLQDVRIERNEVTNDIEAVAFYFYEPKEVDAGQMMSMPKEQILKVKQFDSNNSTKEG
jgi:hypothetical protein